MSKETFFSVAAKPAEQGYILITAVWTLLLCTSTITVIMIHNLRTSEQLSFAREQAQIKYAHESAIETLSAEVIKQNCKGEINAKIFTEAWSTNWNFGSAEPGNGLFKLTN